jgi:hypothetical protein
MHKIFTSPDVFLSSLHGKENANQNEASNKFRVTADTPAMQIIEIVGVYFNRTLRAK